MCAFTLIKPVFKICTNCVTGGEKNIATVTLPYCLTD